MRMLKIVVGGVVGLVAAELAVRLVTSPELDFSSFARPGLYCTDDAINLAPACANQSMMMRVPGEERYVLVKLNQWGFRGPYVNLTHGDHVVKRVLLVGGMSQGFGAGLVEDETYAAAAARGSCGSVEIHNVAMPGIGAEVSWDIAERRVFRDRHFDHVILALYERVGHPDIAARVAPVADQMADLAALNGLEFHFTRRFNSLVRRSALIVRAYDLIARAELQLKWWQPRLTTTHPRGPELKENASLAELIRYWPPARASAVRRSACCCCRGRATLRMRSCKRCCRIHALSTRTRPSAPPGSKTGVFSTAITNRRPPRSSAGWSPTRFAGLISRGRECAF